MIRRLVTATVVAMAACALLIGVAAIAIPNDPWVQIDRSSPDNSDNATLPLKPGRIVALEVRVPELGLDRLDVTFVGVEPERTHSVQVRALDASDQSRLWTSDLELTQVPDGTPSQLLLPHFTRRMAKSLIFEFEGRGTPSHTTLALKGGDCKCVPSARVLSGAPASIPLGGDYDLELATFARVDRGEERLRITGDRIDATHPPGFGSITLIVAAIVAGIAGIAIMVALVLLLADDHRREVSPTRRRIWPWPRHKASIESE